jgi:hypothetical protein
VFEIASEVQTGFASVAQAQYDAYSRRTQTLVDDVAKSAPAGSEAAVAAWKPAVKATNTLIDTMWKSYQQAAQVKDSNLDAMSVSAPRLARRSAAEQLSVAAKR